MIEIQLGRVHMQPHIKEGLQWWNSLEAENGDGRLWQRIARWSGQEQGLLCPINLFHGGVWSVESRWLSTT